MGKTRNTHHLVTGAAKTLVIDLEQNDLPLVIPNGTNVRAVVRGVGMPPVVCLSSTPGADWSVGKVAIPFSSSHTALCASTKNARIEIKVEGVNTFFADIEIESGEIPDV
ncbi:MAG: hypothetical protein RLZZ156_509 [Deinococcota bacterium]|jgi:hypothetical protein